MSRLILCTLFFITIYSCKSNKKAIEGNNNITTEVEVKTPTSGGDILKEIDTYYTLPEWTSAKGTIDASMGESNISLDAIIQIRKDSAILLIAKKFGFEGGRALITRDSVFIINRLEQTYDKLSLAAIASKFNLPPQFDVIQKILLGCPAKINDTAPFQMQQQDSVIVLLTESGSIGATHNLAKKDLRLLQTFVEDEQNAAKMTIFFDNYKITSLQKQFAFHRNLIFISPRSGQGEIDIDFSDVEFNVPKSLRFQIPAHYKRKQYINN